MWLPSRALSLLLYIQHLPSQFFPEFLLMRLYSGSVVDHCTCIPCVLVEFPAVSPISPREGLPFRCSPLSTSTLQRGWTCLLPSNKYHSRVLTAFLPPSLVIFKLVSPVMSHTYVLYIFPFSPTWTSYLRSQPGNPSPSRVGMPACVTVAFPFFSCCNVIY
jgi:hypothetical protein